LGLNGFGVGITVAAVVEGWDDETIFCRRASRIATFVLAVESDV
jgi:hypothetical protein